MAGIDRSTRRAIAVIALLVLAAVALRGYLPGIEEPPSASGRRAARLALVVDVVMLTAAVAVIGFAIITRLRDRRAEAGHQRGVTREVRRLEGRPTWRFSLIALGLLIGWLVLILLLMRVGAPRTRRSARARARDGADRTSAPPDCRDTQPLPNPPPEAGYQCGRIPVPADADPDGPRHRRHRGRIAAAAARCETLPLRRRDHDDVQAPPPAAATESLARAAELGLAEIGDLSREPREAIIACYAAMERELTRVPGAVPQDFDTPTEVLARAVEHHALRADSATRAGRAVRGGAVQPARDDRGTPRRGGAVCCSWSSPNSRSRGSMKKLVAAGVCLVIIGRAGRTRRARPRAVPRHVGRSPSPSRSSPCAGSLVPRGRLGCRGAARRRPRRVVAPLAVAHRNADQPVRVHARDWDRHLRPMLARQFELATGQRRVKNPGGVSGHRPDALRRRTVDVG